MSGVANFFKKKDRLDYNRFITCPSSGSRGKQYVMEKGKNICPCCGVDFDSDTIADPDLVGHTMFEYTEG